MKMKKKVKGPTITNLIFFDADNIFNNVFTGSCCTSVTHCGFQKQRIKLLKKSWPFLLWARYCNTCLQATMWFWTDRRRVGYLKKFSNKTNTEFRIIFFKSSWCFKLTFDMQCLLSSHPALRTSECLLEAAVWTSVLCGCKYNFLFSNRTKIRRIRFPRFNNSQYPLLICRPDLIVNTKGIWFDLSFFFL